MVCCGPIPLSQWVANSDAAVAAFSVDGEVTGAWQTAIS